MKSKLNHFKEILNRYKGELSHIQKQIETKKFEKKKISRSCRLNEKAQIVIQEVVRMTQEKLKYHLSDISSLAMSSIFPDPYNVVFDFVPKRGKIETDIWFEKNENLLNPFSTGGGAVDVASLSFRFSCWTLQKPRTRPIMFLDEPLKFLKGDSLPSKGADMISQISKKLNMQIIMVSHNPELIDSADNIIEINIKNRRSYVK